MLGGYDGYSERSLRTYLSLTRYLSNYRKHGIGHMACPGYKGEKGCDEGADDSDRRWILSEEFLRKPYEIVESSGCLHRGSCGDYGCNHQHYVDRRGGGLESENEHKHSHADASHDPETYASKSRTDYDGSKYDKQL